MIYRRMHGGSAVLLLQTLAEFNSVTIRKAAIPVDDVRTMIDAWWAVLPVQAAEDEELSAALGASRQLS
jgi:predicted nucleic acid-binding protein